MALTNNYLVTYGNDKVAAMGIVLKINMIVLLVMIGLPLEPNHYLVIIMVQVILND